MVGFGLSLKPTRFKPGRVQSKVKPFPRNVGRDMRCGRVSRVLMCNGIWLNSQQRDRPPVSYSPSKFYDFRKPIELLQLTYLNYELCEESQFC